MRYGLGYFVFENRVTDSYSSITRKIDTAMRQTGLDAADIISINFVENGHKVIAHYKVKCIDLDTSPDSHVIMEKERKTLNAAKSSGG